jgi:hypothetical protein
VVLAGSDGASVDLFIDGGDLTGEEPIPAWNGPATIVLQSDQMTSGSVEFDVEIMPPDPKMPQSTREWPARLSGTIEWTCGSMQERSDPE